MIQELHGLTISRSPRRYIRVEQDKCINPGIKYYIFINSICYGATYAAPIKYNSGTRGLFDLAMK